MFDHGLEVDNPGGLFKGMSVEELGKRAIRRNRMLADLMQRAGYIENAGTGITRIKESLKDNNNPDPEFIITNFFTVRLKIRPKNLTADNLTGRQKILYSFVVEKGRVSKSDCQKILNVSSDTTLNELKQLINRGLLQTSGKGKNTRYSIR
jgi:ATP-dependent DNA helicase RecG